MMKKDDYRTEFEVNRQEIDLDEENNNGKIQSRTELHSKARKPKKNSVHRLINILLVLFTLIPIGILAFVISNWFSPGDNLSPKAEDSQFHVETSKNTSEKKPDSSDKDAAIAEEDKLKKQELEKEAQAKKEQEEKEKIAKQKQEEQAKQEELAKKEEERIKTEQAEQAKKAQEEQAAKEREEQAKKEAEKPAARSHTVAAGETLYRISVNYYNSGDGVSKIMAANGLASNEIVKGQTLIIP